jgi:3-hydroxyisobutyrate dehydrogenase
MADVRPGVTRVGWVGTGVMGASMASHLMSAGYSVTAFNRTISKTDALKANGAAIALSPKQVQTPSLTQLRVPARL